MWTRLCDLGRLNGFRLKVDDSFESEHDNRTICVTLLCDGISIRGHRMSRIFSESWSAKEFLNHDLSRPKNRVRGLEGKAPCVVGAKAADDVRR